MGTKFEQPYANVNMPFWAVLGNHDYGANGSGTDMARGANEVAYAMKPGQTKFKMPAKHYKFTAGHAEFFATDTNEVYVGGLPITFGFDDAQQRTTMRTWIAASTATWKISLGHHPYKSNGPHGNAGSYEGIPFLGNSVKSFFDNELCGKVDVSLSGHDHSMQWITAQCQATEIIVSGGGASTTNLTTSNATHYQTDQSGFIYITLVDRTFTATFVNSMGTQLYTRSFAK